jgi:lipid-A-disaccharide synthase
VSYAIAKKLVNIRFIGLPNLILDRAVVKELIQDDFNVQLLKEALTGILTDETTRQQIKKDYQELYALLKQGGHASDNAAKMIMDVVRAKQ